MTAQRLNNPLAPPALNGLSSITSEFEDRFFAKSFTVTLAPNQNLVNQAVQLDRDADFIWSGVQVSYTGLPFSVRFSDSSGYYLSDNYVGSFAFAANAGIGAPYIIEPELFMPAGSAIVLDLQELSGNANGPIQFVFLGRKRYKRSV
jgi:hypothetical protein